MNCSLMAQWHLKNLDDKIRATRNKSDEVRNKMEELVTKYGKGKFSEISTADAQLFTFADFKEFAGHFPGEVTKDHPDPTSASAVKFRQQLMTSLRNALFSSATQTDIQLVELDYTEEAKQFLFAITVLYVKDNEKKMMHFLSCCFGKQWTSATGHALDKDWWDDHDASVKAFLQHGALKLSRAALAVDDGQDDGEDGVNNSASQGAVKPSEARLTRKLSKAALAGACGQDDEDDRVKNSVRQDVSRTSHGHHGHRKRWVKKTTQ